MMDRDDINNNINDDDDDHDGDKTRMTKLINIISLISNVSGDWNHVEAWLSYVNRHMITMKMPTCSRGTKSCVAPMADWAEGSRMEYFEEVLLVQLGQPAEKTNDSDE